jgi:hypothetical protein
VFLRHGQPGARVPVVLALEPGPNGIETLRRIGPGPADEDGPVGLIADWGRHFDAVSNASGLRDPRPLLAELMVENSRYRERPAFSNLPKEVHQRIAANLDLPSLHRVRAAFGRIGGRLPLHLERPAAAYDEARWGLRNLHRASPTDATTAIRQLHADCGSTAGAAQAAERDHGHISVAGRVVVLAGRLTPSPTSHEDTGRLIEVVQHLNVGVQARPIAAVAHSLSDLLEAEAHAATPNFMTPELSAIAVQADTLFELAAGLRTPAARGEAMHALVRLMPHLSGSPARAMWGRIHEQLPRLDARSQERVRHQLLASVADGSIRHHPEWVLIPETATEGISQTLSGLLAQLGALAGFLRQSLNEVHTRLRTLAPDSAPGRLMQWQDWAPPGIDLDAVAARAEQHLHRRVTEILSTLPDPEDFDVREGLSPEAQWRLLEAEAAMEPEGDTAQALQSLIDSTAADALSLSLAEAAWERTTARYLENFSLPDSAQRGSAWSGAVREAAQRTDGNPAAVGPLLAQLDVSYPQAVPAPAALALAEALARVGGRTPGGAPEVARLIDQGVSLLPRIEDAGERGQVLAALVRAGRHAGEHVHAGLWERLEEASRTHLSPADRPAVWTELWHLAQAPLPEPTAPVLESRLRAYTGLHFGQRGNEAPEAYARAWIRGAVQHAFAGIRETEPRTASAWARAEDDAVAMGMNGYREQAPTTSHASVFPEALLRDVLVQVLPDLVGPPRMQRRLGTIIDRLAAVAPDVRHAWLQGEASRVARSAAASGDTAPFRQMLALAAGLATDEQRLDVETRLCSVLSAQVQEPQLRDMFLRLRVTAWRHEAPAHHSRLLVAMAAQLPQVPPTARAEMFRGITDNANGLPAEDQAPVLRELTRQAAALNMRHPGQVDHGELEPPHLLVGGMRQIGEAPDVGAAAIERSLVIADAALQPETFAMMRPRDRLELHQALADLLPRVPSGRRPGLLSALNAVVTQLDPMAQPRALHGLFDQLPGIPAQDMHGVVNGLVSTLASTEFLDGTARHFRAAAGALVRNRDVRQEVPRLGDLLRQSTTEGLLSRSWPEYLGRQVSSLLLPSLWSLTSDAELSTDPSYQVYRAVVAHDLLQALASRAQGLDEQQRAGFFTLLGQRVGDLPHPLSGFTRTTLDSLLWMEPMNDNDRSALLGRLMHEANGPEYEDPAALRALTVNAWRSFSRSRMAVDPGNLEHTTHAAHALLRAAEAAPDDAGLRQARHAIVRHLDRLVAFQDEDRVRLMAQLMARGATDSVPPSAEDIHQRVQTVLQAAVEEPALERDRLLRVFEAASTALRPLHRELPPDDGPNAEPARQAAQAEGERQRRFVQSLHPLMESLQDTPSLGGALEGVFQMARAPAAFTTAVRLTTPYIWDAMATADGNPLLGQLQQAFIAQGHRTLGPGAFGALGDFIAQAPASPTQHAALARFIVWADHHASLRPDDELGAYLEHRHPPSGAANDPAPAP